MPLTERRYPAVLTEVIDTTTDIQIWRATFRTGLPGITSWREIRPSVWERDREGHNACDCRKVGPTKPRSWLSRADTLLQYNRYRRNRSPPARCPQDQETNQPRSLPRPRRIPNRSRRRNGALPRRRMDSCAKRSRIIRREYLNTPRPQHRYAQASNKPSSSVAPPLQKNTSTS